MPTNTGRCRTFEARGEGIPLPPPVTQSALHSYLDPSRAASIHPLFVFSGLALIRREKPVVNDDVKISKRNTAWDAVTSGKMELAMSAWSTVYGIHPPDLIHLVIRILKEHNIDYIRAPYGAGAQVCTIGIDCSGDPTLLIH